MHYPSPCSFKPIHGHPLCALFSPTSAPRRHQPPHRRCPRAQAPRPHAQSWRFPLSTGPRLRPLGLEFRPVRPDIDPTNTGLVAMVYDIKHGTEHGLRNFLFPVLRQTYDDLLAAATTARARRPAAPRRTELRRPPRRRGHRNPLGQLRPRAALLLLRLRPAGAAALPAPGPRRHGYPRHSAASSSASRASSAASGPSRSTNFAASSACPAAPIRSSTPSTRPTWCWPCFPASWAPSRKTGLPHTRITGFCYLRRRRRQRRAAAAS